MSENTAAMESPDRSTWKPEAVFRIGSVSASVFAHEIQGDGATRRIRSVSLQRRYHDGDKAKYSSSFGLNDLPQAIRVLRLARNYVEAREALVHSAE